MTSKYTSREMMAVAAAREIRDGEIIFCGTGLSMLAAMAAKHISAPNSVVIFETGAIDARPAEVPMAVADSRVMPGAAMHCSLADAFAFLQNRFSGRKVVGILGAAQVDPFGNLNSTLIGDFNHPAVRFSGSGGACDVGSLVHRTIIFMKQEKRKFVSRLDYLTCPGWLDGPGKRQAAGLGPGGPAAVVTDMGIFRFDEGTGRMYLAGCFKGVSSRDILDAMDFTVDDSRARGVAPPSELELSILRRRCDPQRLILE